MEYIEYNLNRMDNLNREVIEPNFIDKITQNGIILTSTAGESEKGFVFLVLSTNNEQGTSFFDSYHKLIREVR